MTSEPVSFYMDQGYKFTLLMPQLKYITGSSKFFPVPVTRARIAFDDKSFEKAKSTREQASHMFVNS